MPPILPQYDSWTRTILYGSGRVNWRFDEGQRDISPLGLSGRSLRAVGLQGGQSRRAGGVLASLETRQPLAVAEAGQGDHRYGARQTHAPRETARPLLLGGMTRSKKQRTRGLVALPRGMWTGNATTFPARLGPIGLGQHVTPIQQIRARFAAVDGGTKLTQSLGGSAGATRAR